MGQIGSWDRARVGGFSEPSGELSLQMAEGESVQGWGARHVMKDKKHRQLSYLEGWARAGSQRGADGQA